MSAKHHLFSTWQCEPPPSLPRVVRSVNDPMVAGTGLRDACHIGTNATAFASIVLQLYHQAFTKEEIILRKQLLGTTYDNERNTRQLIQWLW